MLHNRNCWRPPKLSSFVIRGRCTNWSCDTLWTQNWVWIKTKHGWYPDILFNIILWYWDRHTDAARIYTEQCIQYINTSYKTLLGQGKKSSLNIKMIVHRDGIKTYQICRWQASTMNTVYITTNFPQTLYQRAKPYFDQSEQVLQPLFINKCMTTSHWWKYNHVKYSTEKKIHTDKKIYIAENLLSKLSMLSSYSNNLPNLPSWETILALTILLLIYILNFLCPVLFKH